MSRKLIGYVVLDDDGRPTALGGSNNVHWWAGRSGATLYPTRARAIAALKRSDQYARDHDLRLWHTEKWEVLAIRGLPHSGHRRRKNDT